MTSALRPVDPSRTVGLARTLLDRLERRIGELPAPVLVVANSRCALQGYLSFFGALRNAGLSARVCEQIALFVSDRNDNEFGVAEHAMLGRQLGLSEAEVALARQGRSRETRTAAALAFAKAVLETGGDVAEADLERVRAAGYSEGQIVEIAGHVALNLFAGYIAHLSRLTAEAIATHGQGTAGRESPPWFPASSTRSTRSSNMERGL